VPIKRVNPEKVARRQRKAARRHLQKYKWKLAEIRSGVKTDLDKKEKWILKKALWAERFLHGHQTSD
jgi:hypothetical protein